MKTVRNILFLLWILLLAPNGQAQQQNVKEDSQWPYPFTLQTIQAVCVDTNFTTVAITKTYPPKKIKKVDSYVYEVSFTLNFSGNPNGWAEPFYLSVQEANLDTTILTFNAAQEALGIHNNPTFSFSWKTEQQGILQIVLGYSVEGATLQFDTGNPFLSKRFSLAENR